MDCNEVSVDNATIEGSTVNEVTVEPTYAGCTVRKPGTEVGATVTTNGCHYTFHGETTEDVTGKQSAPVDIVCPPEKEITVDFTVFKFAVPAHPLAGTGGRRLQKRGDYPRDADNRSQGPRHPLDDNRKRGLRRRHKHQRPL